MQAAILVHHTDFKFIFIRFLIFLKKINYVKCGFHSTQLHLIQQSAEIVKNFYLLECF